MKNGVFVLLSEIVIPGNLQRYGSTMLGLILGALISKIYSQDSLLEDDKEITFGEQLMFRGLLVLDLSHARLFSGQTTEPFF